MQLEPYLVNRNLFRVMLPYFEDSARLKSFLRENCDATVVLYPNTTLYVDYFPKHTPATLTAQDRMLVCTDARTDALGDWLKCVRYAAMRAVCVLCCVLGHAVR